MTLTRPQQRAATLPETLLRAVVTHVDPVRVILFSSHWDAYKLSNEV